jgi:proton-dependent oligopeptide transporter, POT family
VLHVPGAGAGDSEIQRYEPEAPSSVIREPDCLRRLRNVYSSPSVILQKFIGKVMPLSRTNRIRPTGSDFLGHPRGLTFLFATEMWERFSYYGMRALLVLYMVKYLLLPGQGGAIGLGAIRGVLESLFGPLGVQPFASQIYGLYTGFVYLTPFFGGWLADHVLGQRRTVILGAALMAIGHFMMAFERLFLLALLMLILGNGAFKPNISTQVGGLYAPGDHRRDRAYSIFYVGINVGAFLAPLVCGTLGEELGWHFGFAAAGVGMTIALLVYLYAMPMLPPDEMHKAKAAGRGKEPLDRNEWRAVLTLVALFLPTTMFWATYEQQGNTIALWADEHTDRAIDLIVWHGAIPVTWFQAFNPFMIFAFTPLIIAFWAWQEKHGNEPSTITKMALGCFGVSFSYLIMAAAAWSAGNNPATWWWLFAYFAIITLGELYLSPIGLSLVSKIAPPRMISTMMGLWLGTSFIGNFAAGWLGSFWSVMDKTSFFIMIAAVAAGAGAVIWSFNRPLKNILLG